MIRSARSLGVIAAVLACAVLTVVGAAQATITPAGALAIAQAIASPSANVTGASFVAIPGGTPDGVSTTSLTGFPTDGSSFGVLTSGNVADVGSPTTFANTNDGGGSVRGNTDMDVSILKVDLDVPSTANCLTFDFRFLSEEYPGYVGTQFNDAFIAELDSSTWTTSGSTISAPNNFAFDSSHNVVSVNSTGIGGMSAANGSGTAFNGGTIYSADLGFAPPNGDGPAGGATVLLHASHQVTPGAHSLFLSLFDQGDRILDSAVFLDNLVVGFVPNPAVNCVPGAQPVNFKLSLTPPTASNPTFTSHTVTATLTDSSNNPVGNAPIEFTVTGPNATTGTSTTNSSGVATFTYTGTHEGTDLISACYKDGAPICLAVATVQKTWTDPLIAATGTSLNAVEGVSFTGTVATFHDPDPTSTAGEYGATIDWGDSSTSAGTITGSGGNFTVSGTHTYAEEGPPLTVKVTITDLDNAPNTATALSSATVADASLTATGLNLVSGFTYTGPVATFKDANTGAPTSDFTATIDWGDTHSTSGTVTGSAGSYTVNGTHTYATTGPFMIKVHIVDDGGSTADATTAILIFGTASGGAFVIGNGDAAVGHDVTFWSSQWSKENTLAAGSAPAQFKGFASTPDSLPACGTAWSTRPGNSPPPPAGSLPAFMAVIVSSSVTKSGSTISGNVLHEVVVQTNAGYAPNPGHPGTGTVVATIC
jgi:Big-like domain-containing protein